jgi:Uma2 family endonuclease
MNWQQACDAPELNDLPYRIELNRWGQLVMSRINCRHSAHIGEISWRLRQCASRGSVTICAAVNTADNIKVVDVSWMTKKRWNVMKNDDFFCEAPEICVEVLTSENSIEEMMLRRDLFFQSGALEFWLCSADGAMTFYGAEGVLAKSKLVPKFPTKIEV